MRNPKWNITIYDISAAAKNVDLDGNVLCAKDSNPGAEEDVTAMHRSVACPPPSADANPRSEPTMEACEPILTSNVKTGWVSREGVKRISSALDIRLLARDALDSDLSGVALHDPRFSTYKCL